MLQQISLMLVSSMGYYSRHHLLTDSELGDYEFELQGSHRYSLCLDERLASLR